MAVALWVEENPPDSGISKAMAELIKATSSSKAVRETLDQAIREWRASHDEGILSKVIQLNKEAGGLNLPGDVQEAITEYGKR